MAFKRLFFAPVVIAQLKDHRAHLR
eukprot:COSAG06_NODE_8652_length_2106_cov_0.958645_3_plen_24_part_01